jgi:cytochrome P450
MTLPPGPPLPALAQTLFWVRRPVEMLQWCRRKYGPTFSLNLPRFRMVMVSEPEPIRTIFAARQDEMHAGHVNRVLRSIVGDSSVLLLDGREHMRQRKLLMPSFQGERMRFYGETMAEVTRRVAERWPSGEPFVMHQSAQEITLEVILRTVFGADDGAELEALRSALVRLLKVGEGGHMLLQLIYLAHHPEAETRLPWRWMLHHRDSADRLLYAKIAARRADPDAARRKDVLAMLLAARDEAGEGMTDRELRDELMTALLAGHETTATALAWTFERLLATPQAYERLRAEVRACGRRPAAEQLAALPYLDATVKEVLRLRPIVPVVGRILQRPYELAGYALPAGTVVGACIFLAQRDPNVYPEPDAFRPERFLGVQPDPASWLPFGGGIRRCIGLWFALYELKIVLGTMLAEHEFELAQSGPSRIVRRAITFSPEGGTRVRVRDVA